MSLSGAEKAGLFGGVLLAAALITLGIIMFRSGRTPEPNESPDPPANTGTAAVDGDPRPESSGKSGGPEDPQTSGTPESPETPEVPVGEAGLHRELARLRDVIRDQEEEIERLKEMLRKAGITAEEERKEPTLEARAAIEELKRCGPETDTIEIEDLVERIVAAGTPAVPEIERTLESDLKVGFTDTWTVLGGRLLGYPGLRLALIDALARIGGISGESALVTTLRGNEDPLEICLLISYLDRVRNVRTVADVCRDAALRYLDLAPHRQERQVVLPLLGVLASIEPPEAAANALLRYTRERDRKPAQAEVAIQHLNRLPEAVAIKALVALALDESIGTKAEDAAELLVLRDGAAFDAVPEVLETCSPRVRGVIYRFLARPVLSRLQDARSRSARSGLEALAVLDGLDESIAARRAIADEWREKEREANLANQLMSARTRLTNLAEESAALRKKLTVE